MEEKKETLEAVEVRDSKRTTVLSFSYAGGLASFKMSVMTGAGAQITVTVNDVEIPPHKALVGCMDLLAEDLAAECELETSDNAVTFTKFTATHKGDSIGYKLVGKRALIGSRSPMSLVSPLKWDSHPDEIQQLDPVTVDRLEALKE